MENISEAIGYDQTAHFSRIVLDYLREKEPLRKFYRYSPALSSFGEAINDKAKENINRQLLADIISKQNISAEINVSASTLNNIELLKKQTTFSVTTGHQLCIYTGPLYFIYKIATVINLAKELKKQYPENDFIPVFWLASEDHDFEEINHIKVFGKKLVWDPKQPTGGPVGRLNPFSLSLLNEELKSIMGSDSNATALLEIFEKMAEKNNLSEAIKFLVNELFGREGIVILDGDDAAFKKVFIPVIENDLFEDDHSAILTATSSELSDLNYKVQVNVRSSNFFIFNKNKRERIDKVGNDFLLAGSGEKISASEMRIKVENTPELFSPNVLMRPLFQEMILPNIAYVGGGGELAYWFQLKSVFDFHKLNFPLLILRNSIQFIDSNSAQKLDKLNIQRTEIFKPIDELVNKFIAANTTVEISLDEEQKAIDDVFKKIIEKAELTDPTLRATAEAEQKKLQASLKNLEGKFVKAEKQKHDVAIGQIKKVKEKLFPDNGLQERSENFISFYLKYGHSWLDLVLEQANPFQFEFKIITEKA
jgi:bacillithiol synthase